MERAYHALKQFILTSVNALLPSFEDEAVRLPLLTEETIRFGAIDTLKQAGETLCAIWPSTLATDEEYQDGSADEEASCTVAFLCRGAAYEELVPRSCRYAAAFRKAARQDPTLQGAVEDAISGTVSFYPDCGAAERQAAACEIEVSIYLMEDSGQ